MNFYMENDFKSYGICNCNTLFLFLSGKDAVLLIKA